MDEPQLRDEVVRDRVRSAEEFLDPSMPAQAPLLSHLTLTSRSKIPIIPRRYHSHAQP